MSDVRTLSVPPASREGLLERIDELLEVSYRSADLGNLEDPLAETVYILLSRQTREAVYRRTYRELRNRCRRWIDVLTLSDRQLEQILTPCGFQRQRTGQLKALLATVHEANANRAIGPAAHPPADLTLDFLRGMTNAEAETFLVGLPGIGPKSARCVLAYALHRPSFAVDTHVHRIFKRLGLVKSNGRKADHNAFQDVVPERMRQRMHINLVHHGRAVCQSHKTRCGDCALVSFCKQGQRAIVRDSRPAAVDLFGGAGGLGAGFREAGFRIALAVENDRHAAQTYRANHPGVPVIESKIDASTTATELRAHMPGLKQVAVVIAGPPCQGYSVAGARDPAVEINQLYRQVARLARELRAQAICLENVPGLRRVKDHRFLDSIAAELEYAGYTVTAQLLRAYDFGVPQHRQRYFFLGQRGVGGMNMPPPPATHRRHGKRDPAGLPETPTLASVLSQVPTINAGVDAEPFIGTDGRAYYNMSTMAHSDRVVEKIHRIRPGEGPISYRRLPGNEAPTLIAGHRALPVHPHLDRTISVREAALIQGFPIDYVFCGPRAGQPLQVANAVPPPMARAVASHLLRGSAVFEDRWHRSERRGAD